MGAWGTGNFENDGALDFLIQLENNPTIQTIHQAIDAVINHAGYMDVDYGDEAIAAAEVVAMINGQPAADDLPDNFKAWFATQSFSVDKALTERAILAVEKAFNDTELSELRQLWDESNDFPMRQAHVNTLLAKLRNSINS